MTKHKKMTEEEITINLSKDFKRMMKRSDGFLKALSDNVKGRT
jgi:hypothetical protein